MGNTGGTINVPSVGSFGGTLKMDEHRNISASTEANANVYGACTVGAKLAVDENKTLSGGCKAAIDLSPIAKAELNINVDKYCKFNTGVHAKLNFGLIRIGGHAEIDQNGQKSAGFDIHSTMASNESIGGNVEIDKNGEMSGGVSVEKKFDRIDVVIEKKGGIPNFSRTTNPENERPGQLTGERSGDFGGSIKVGDTNYQTDFMQTRANIFPGVTYLRPNLWTYDRSGDVGSKSLILSNFGENTKLGNLKTEHWTHKWSEDVVSSGDNIGNTNRKTNFLDTFMRARDDKVSGPIILSNFGQNSKPVNLGTEPLTYERSDDVGSCDKIGDTNHQTDFMDTFIQTKDNNSSEPMNWSNYGHNTKLGNLGTEHWTHERKYDVGSFDKIGDTNHQKDLMDKLMQTRDDKFSKPIILSNFGQNTKPVNIGTEHLTYGRSDDVGSYFLDTFKQTKDKRSSEPMNWSNFGQNTKLGNLITEQRTHERRYDVGGSFGLGSPFTLSTQKSGWFN